MGTLLFAGGEDFDFPNGTVPGVNTSNSSARRTSYARCALNHIATEDYISYVFPAGAVTSLWLSCQLYFDSKNTSQRLVGLSKSGLTTKGIYIGESVASSTRLSLVKWDNTTQTELATESGNSIGGAVQKIDMHVATFGSDTVIDIYNAGGTSAVIHWEGDLSGLSLVNLDTVVIHMSSSRSLYVSEIIVHTDDTRTFSLCTLAPTGAGTTDEWTGAYTDVNETTLNDATVNYINANDQAQQYTVSALPSGSFRIIGMVLAARTTRTSDSTPTNIKLGINSGGSIDDGSAQAITASVWQQIVRYMATNPITSNEFSQTEINAIQIQKKSAA